MIALTQIRNNEILASIAAIAFNLLNRKLLFTNRKGNGNFLKSRLLFKKTANFTGKLLQNYK